MCMALFTGNFTFIRVRSVIHLVRTKSHERLSYRIKLGSMIT